MKRVIKTSRDLREAKGALLRKDVYGFSNKPIAAPPNNEYKAYSVVRLVLKYRKETGVTACVIPTQVPASRYSPFVERTVTRGMVGDFSVDRLSRAFINVRLDGDAAAFEKVRPYLMGAIFSNKKSFFTETPRKGVYRDLLRGEDVTIDVSKMIVYGGDEATFVASNGQIKKREVSYFAQNLPGFDAKWMLDELTYGLVGRLEAAGRTAETKKQIAQLSTRLGQPSAPAVEGLEVRTEAYLMGIYDPRWDGEIYVSGDFARDWCADRLGENFIVDRRAVKGMTFQCRPHMCKGNGSVVSRDYMTHFLVSHEWEPIVLIRSEISEEDQIAFDTAVWSKGKEGKFAGKIVLLVDSIDDLHRYGVEVFTDLNGLKETFDLSRRSGLNVLAITGEDEDEGRKTSTQTFATYLAADKKSARDIFVAATKKEVEHVYSSIMEEDGRAPSYIESFDEKDKANYGQLFASVAPGFARKVWAPMFRTIVNNAMEGLDTKISNSNVPIDGTQGFLVVDPAIDFGFESLKFDAGIAEVFCRDIEGKEGILNRYPAANLFAFTRVVGVTVDVLVERAKEAGLDEECVKLFKARIAAIPDGIIVVPADTLLAAKHDGWDFDGDHGNIVVEEEVLEITNDLTSEVVMICENEEEYLDILNQNGMQSGSSFN